MPSITQMNTMDSSSSSTPCCTPAQKQTGLALKHQFPPQLLQPVFRNARWTLSLLCLVICIVILMTSEAVGTWTIVNLLPEIGRNLQFVARAAWGILPYFCLGVAISAWVQTSEASERIKHVFGHRESVAIPLAAVIGATIPLCSCSVVPLIAALLVGGAPLGAIMALWISSPLMSPAVFILTAGTLGIPYAVARLATAILMGAAAGYVTSLLVARDYLHDPLRPNVLAAAGCCRPTSPHHINTSRPHRARLFWSNLRRPAIFLSKWLLLAFCLEALIVHYVDPSWITTILGTRQSYSIPMAMLVGIPLYVSDIAAVPIIEGMLNHGMAPGAALTFLIAGPVTTIPAMVTVWALVRRRTFAIYLSAGILGSLMAGYLFQLYVG